MKMIEKAAREKQFFTHRVFRFFLLRSFSQSARLSIKYIESKSVASFFQVKRDNFFCLHRFTTHKNCFFRVRGWGSIPLKSKRKKEEKTRRWVRKCCERKDCLDSRILTRISSVKRDERKRMRRGRRRGEEEKMMVTTFLNPAPLFFSRWKDHSFLLRDSESHREEKMMGERESQTINH